MTAGDGSAITPPAVRPVAVLVFVLLLVLLSGCRAGGPRGAQSPEADAAATGRAGVTARVLRVVDGDTIIVRLNGREERLRYIGINTPESVTPDQPVECFGREASEANKKLVAGKTVRLERDVSDRDRFGRLLRYVYVGDTFVNGEMVRQGYANAITIQPDVRENDRLRALEREARDAGRGLWSRCRRNGS
jgi:micrococcal nuclease